MLLTKKQQARKSPPIAAPTLYLGSVHCVQQKATSGKDFIYIQITGGKPGLTLVGMMAAGETKLLAQQVSLPPGACWLELWDKETISTNDRMGKIDLLQCRYNVAQEITIRKDAACYRLGFKLVI